MHHLKIHMRHNMRIASFACPNALHQSICVMKFDNCIRKTQMRCLIKQLHHKMTIAAFQPTNATQLGECITVFVKCVAMPWTPLIYHGTYVVTHQMHRTRRRMQLTRMHMRHDTFVVCPRNVIMACKTKELQIGIEVHTAGSEPSGCLNVCMISLWCSITRITIVAAVLFALSCQNSQGE